MKTPLKGSLSISRHGGHDGTIAIRISDDSSRTEFVEAEISLDQFAAAITGMGACACTFLLKGVSRVGSTAENKTEIVPFDMYESRKSEAAIKKALKPFEVDGWRAREGDMTNGHCAVHHEGKRAQRVVFFRHVAQDGTPILS